MPRYEALRDTWLGHENRLVRAGEQFETVFPQVKVEGKLVDMRLGENLQLVPDEPPAAPSRSARGSGAPA